MHGRDRPAVAGDADEAREPLGLGAHTGFEGAVGPHRPVPVVGMTERVQLDQIDVIHAQPLERAMQVLARLARRAAAGLGGQEEVLAVARHPRSDAELGISIARGRVDVIDAVAQQHLEGAVGIVLARASERRRAEQHHAALMTGAAERSPLERRARHGITQPPLGCST